MDIYFLFGASFPTHFSLSLHPLIYNMVNPSNILCPRCTEKDTIILYSMASCPKVLQTLLLDLSIRPTLLISLSKLLSKRHWEFSPQFDVGVQLKTLIPKLLQVFIRHLSYCGKLFIMVDMTQLMNSFTLTVILPKEAWVSLTYIMNNFFIFKYL